jgi:hypothetical protein
MAHNAQLFNRNDVVFTYRYADKLLWIILSLWTIFTHRKQSFKLFKSAIIVYFEGERFRGQKFIENELAKQFFIANEKSFRLDTFHEDNKESPRKSSLFFTFNDAEATKRFKYFIIHEKSILPGRWVAELNLIT